MIEYKQLMIFYMCLCFAEFLPFLTKIVSFVFPVFFCRSSTNGVITENSKKQVCLKFS